MLYKYALFTAVVSVLPFLFIINDLSNSWRRDVLTFLYNFLSKVHKIFSVTNEDKKSQVEANVDRLFTEKQLRSYTGEIQNNDLYLVILGNVFDVTKGKRFYGPGEHYHSFLGRDASRAFITGDYTENGLTDHVLDLNYQELKGLKDWLEFYKREYTYKGKLIGRYYGNEGNPTPYHEKLLKKFKEVEEHEENKNHYKFMFPPCNVEWSPEKGSRVWCTRQSGGIDRDWIGVPRKYFEPGSKNYRCACVNISDNSESIKKHEAHKRTGNIEEYKGCNPKSTSCYNK